MLTANTGVIIGDTLLAQRRGLQNVKKECEFKHFKIHGKLTTIFDVSSLFYDLQDVDPSSAKTIVECLSWSERRGTALSSHRVHVLSEDVKNAPSDVYRTKTVLGNTLWDYELFIPFVLHEESFCFWRPRRRACHVVDLKVPHITTEKYQRLRRTSWCTSNAGWRARPTGRATQIS